MRSQAEPSSQGSIWQEGLFKDSPPEQLEVPQLGSLNPGFSQGEVQIPRTLPMLPSQELQGSGP